MDGGESVGALAKTQPVEALRPPRRGCGKACRIVHYVTDIMDTVSDALAPEIDDAGLGRAQQQRAEVNGQNAVDLFGHATVKRTQARLEIHERNFQLHCGPYAGKA